MEPTGWGYYKHMSFQIPRNVPNFADGSRRIENITWQGFRSSDLPLYKDKPWASPVRRRRFYRRKTTYAFLLAIVGLFLYFRLWEMHMDSLPIHNKASLKWEDRRERIREAFVESWAAFEKNAWGMDEFHPKSMTGKNMVENGMGWIIVDSLDTLMLMNLTDQLVRAREWVANDLNYEKDHEVNVFETTIRMLGGLLSAHYLSGFDDLYLEKATDLADRLTGAYDTPSGIPYASVNLASGRGVPSHDDGGASSTAEATSVQLEMKYIAKLTGETNYWEKAEKVIQVVDSNHAEDGLVPIFIYPATGQFRGRETRLGSRGDSYYEYLLKQYLQTNKQEPVYKELYNEAVTGVKRHLVAKSSPRGLTYIAELPAGIGTQQSAKMDHLVCFLAGNLALGATEGRPKLASKLRGWSKQQQEDLDLAEELTETCYEMYRTTISGLAPEIVWFNTDTKNDLADDMIIKSRDAHNLQRPETVESLFIMWRITGDNKYREWGWKIFEAFQKWSKLPSGAYTSLDDVTRLPPPTRDNMESFWLAETLKYLYLLFSPADLLPLDEVVFNTEGHPLPRFDMGEHFKTGWVRKKPLPTQEVA